MEIQNFNKSKEFNNQKDINQNSGKKSHALFFIFIPLAFLLGLAQSFVFWDYLHNQKA